jgi:lipoprotein signal peptidase
MTGESVAMIALIVGLILIPLLDQALKFFVLLRLGVGTVGLGRIGKLQVVRTEIWMVRASCSLNLVMLWTLWMLAASALVIVTALAPSCGWFAGMLLGGSFSHGMERSLRGWICDYVCARFWPAFNMADVAIVVGASGLALNLILLTKMLG